jgi:hypothetical protein
MAATFRVMPDMKFSHNSAEALYDMTVLRTHRDAGYWECVFLNGPRKGGIWVRSEIDILADVVADQEADATVAAERRAERALSPGYAS